ncbi:amidohydrolase [Chondrinema litorale]|uniref:amidohydrolase n=1 Tax=Chondrinema litorale TaxID=2994555 RepID=UPI00254473FC|nr:amidohydrolase [Chondrinema litorale]UZR93910.1 amidohydrolase [Chondrinema litorale]
MEDLKISLIQTELYWENIQANLSNLEEKIWEITEDTDLILLPEMFNTGFSMNAKALAEPMNLTTTKWMKQMAAQTKAVICGSFIAVEDGKYYNRLIWMQPDGNYSYYDKRHLFRMAKEELTFSAGSTKNVVELKGWKICPLICYDLRFPVWSRNLNNQYDLLLYVANWPAARESAWNALLPARAVENLCYVAGLNRCGEDGKNIPYQGDSQVVDFYGKKILDMENEEDIATITLSAERLEKYRKKFPAHLDADNFNLM